MMKKMLLALVLLCGCADSCAGCNDKDHGSKDASASDDSDAGDDYDAGK